MTSTSCASSIAAAKRSGLPAGEHVATELRPALQPARRAPASPAGRSDARAAGPPRPRPPAALARPPAAAGSERSCTSQAAITTQSPFWPSGVAGGACRSAAASWSTRALQREARQIDLLRPRQGQQALQRPAEAVECEQRCALPFPARPGRFRSATMPCHARRVSPAAAAAARSAAPASARRAGRSPPAASRPPVKNP